MKNLNSNNINSSKSKYNELALYLTEAFLFMNQYEWISNSYVAEFYTQDLWQKLPQRWRECLENVPLKEIASNMLKDEENKKYSTIWPLSLLSFIRTCHALALNRQQNIQHENTSPPELSNIFKKHIKPKKRHELSLLPEVIHNICEKTGAKNIVDVGSGLGHLARFLAYKYGYNVTAIEMTNQQAMAEKFDKQMEQELEHIGKSCKQAFGSVQHIAKRIDADISSEEFCSLIGTSAVTRCILIGLHTCGDLASTMLKVFRNTEAICGLVSVSCCYFKMTLKEVTDGDGAPADVNGEQVSTHVNGAGTLTVASDKRATNVENEEQISVDVDHKETLTNIQYTVTKEVVESSNITPSENDSKMLYSNFTLDSFYKLLEINTSSMKPLQEQSIHNEGFPMSSFLQNIPVQPLKYKSFETACHFIDDYSQKLFDNSPNLKLHCYRAVMEILLRKINPDFILTAVRCKKIKNAAAMNFSEYAENVIRRVTGDFDPTVLNLIDCNELLSRWRCVAIYHSLALLLGPIIESIALVDKWMFLLESDFNASLVPLFDPKISPRNFVVIATKE